MVEVSLQSPSNFSSLLTPTQSDATSVLSLMKSMRKSDISTLRQSIQQSVTKQSRAGSDRPAIVPQTREMAANVHQPRRVVRNLAQQKPSHKAPSTIRHNVQYTASDRRLSRNTELYHPASSPTGAHLTASESGASTTSKLSTKQVEIHDIDSPYAPKLPPEGNAAVPELVQRIALLDERKQKFLLAMLTEIENQQSQPSSEVQSSAQFVADEVTSSLGDAGMWRALEKGLREETSPQSHQSPHLVSTGIVLELKSSWGGGDMCGLTGIELLDSNANEMSFDKHAATVRGRVSKDSAAGVQLPRVFDGYNQTTDPRHMWLCPLHESLKIAIPLDEQVGLCGMTQLLASC